MRWIIITAGAISLLVIAVYFIRRYVCFRRKDCCGKGCGCLFPVKRR